MADSDGLDRLRWRLDALDVWRTETEGRVGWLEGQVREIVKAEELAKMMAARRATVLTQGEKILAGVVTFVVAGCAVGSLIVQVWTS